MGRSNIHSHAGAWERSNLNLHERHPWEVIVEPDDFEKLLVIVTAYPVWSK